MIRATGTRVIVTRVEREQTTTSGLILQGGISREIPQGRIVSVGPKVNCEVKADDLIELDWRGSAEITWQEHKYYVVDESNILGVYSD